MARNDEPTWAMDRGKMYPTIEEAAERVVVSVATLLNPQQREVLGAKVVREMIVVCEAMAAGNSVRRV